jgi:8-oxo-dGTP pyrophosphatase MutT (NUDIX family)
MNLLCDDIDTQQQADEQRFLFSSYSPAIDEFIRRFQLQLPPRPVPQLRARRQAAVLVPIICGQEPRLLLTRRSEHLRKHAGQVAFPGGAADIDDPSIVFTALREAQEEVAIPPSQVKILGKLNPLNSSSGFYVTPVVGLLPANATFSPSADEVAELFEMPLRDAFNLSRYHQLDRLSLGQHQQIYFSWYQQQFIWGLTAAIIHQLAQQVGTLSY